MAEANKIWGGREPTFFSEASREFNHEIHRKFKSNDRRKKFINKQDCRIIFDKFNGRCVWCNIPLTPRGKTKFNLAKFMLHVPIEQGGKVDKDNVLLTCAKCKAVKVPFAKKGLTRMFDFNTLPDLIETLVKLSHKDAVNPNEDVKKMIGIVKRDINVAVQEFVYTLHYKPLDEAKNVHPELRVEGFNTAGDLVLEALEEGDEFAEKFGKVLQEINKFKQYRVAFRQPDHDDPCIE